jgi:hypothetical protein
VGNILPWVAAVIVAILILIVIILLFQPQGSSQTQSKQPKQIKQGWQELARRTSLAYTPPSQSSDTASVRGSYHGYPVALRLRVRTALGRDTQTSVMYTRIEVGLKNQRRIYARLYKKGAFKHTDRAFGVPNVTFGITELDQRFDVKSSPAEFISRLSSSRKQLCQHLLLVHTEHNVGIEVEGDTLVFEQQGIETSPDYLLAILDLLVEFVEAVEQGG